MLVIMLVGYNLPFSIAAQTKQVQTIQKPSNYEIKLVQNAEQLMIVELARCKSVSIKSLHNKCIEMCSIGYSEKNLNTIDSFAQHQCTAMCRTSCLGGIIELSTALLGLSTSTVASDAFVRLLALPLDAGASEDFHCVMAVRGRSLRSRLVDLDAAKVAEFCKSNFDYLRKRELKNVTDVSVEQLCRSEAEIQRHRDRMLEMIDRGAICEE